MDTAGHYEQLLETISAEELVDIQHWMLIWCLDSDRTLNTNVNQTNPKADLSYNLSLLE